MSASGYVVLTVKIKREGGAYVAVCEELGVSTCDESLDGLMRELAALVGQHLNALERNGVRAAFFREHGIRLHRGPIPSAPRSVRPATLPVRAGEFVTRITERIPVAAGL